MVAFEFFKCNALLIRPCAPCVHSKIYCTAEEKCFMVECWNDLEGNQTIIPATCFGTGWICLYDLSKSCCCCCWLTDCWFVFHAAASVSPCNSSISCVCLARMNNHLMCCVLLLVRWFSEGTSAISSIPFRSVSFTVHIVTHYTETHCAAGLAQHKKEKSNPLKQLKSKKQELCFSSFMN